MGLKKFPLVPDISLAGISLSYNSATLPKGITVTTFTVFAGSDHLSKLSKASPISALSELIWNALDADASEVKVILQEGKLDQVEEVLVSDNGKGLPVDQAQERFAQLGGSWKRSKGTSEGGRFLHGSEGKGRFKALSIGRIATWSVVYDELVEKKRYQIEMRADAPNQINISDAVPAEAGAGTGVTVRIEEVGRAVATFAGEEPVSELTETFATYLTDYSDVRIYVHGTQLDPAPLILQRTNHTLTPIDIDGKIWAATLDIIEWKETDKRALYLANERGAPLFKANRKFQVGEGKFTAYLRSGYISQLQEAESLELAELNEHVNSWVNQAQDIIKDYFDKKEVEESFSLIQEWKTEKIYPFSSEPVGAIETAERQVFDIVATRVAKHVTDYSKASKEGLALNLRLLKQAIEKSPEDLTKILDEVLKLPKREQKALADLLNDVSLSNVISASTIVTDRLKLIMGLQTIMYEPNYKKNLKERTQLHRILAQNTWVFGDDWMLSADDRSLTQVLRAHRQHLGDDIEIDADVKHVSKSKGIVDLMFSKTARHYGAKKPAHLVVELKRPSVKIGKSELDQIVDYARSVSKDSRFDKTGCSWDFWLVSTEITEDAAYRIKNGRYETSDESVHIYVKTWSEILDENRDRLQFFKEKLDFDATEDVALKHLAERYSELLQGVVEIEDTEEPSEA